MAAGAVLVTGGEMVGSCYLPTILTDVRPEMACWREEIFGPVAALRKFHTEAEALQEANSTDKGLAAFFYTRDYQQIWGVSSSLEAGLIGVNDVAISMPEAPFGGYKSSGIGKEGAREGLHEYSNTKLINLGGLCRE